MRVAFLARKSGEPDETSNRISGELLDCIISELSRSGIDVQPIMLESSGKFDCADASSSESFGKCEISFGALRDFSAFFGNADSYDLIYNFYGLAPLFVSKNTQTPIITVLNSSVYQSLSNVLDSHFPAGIFLWYRFNGASEGLAPGDEVCLRPGQESTWPEAMANHLLDAGNHLLERLKREDHRPWGYYVVLSDLDDHKVKRIVVYPGKRLSLQSHRRRSEHWLIVSGHGTVTLDSREVRLGPGESVDIPVGTRHRISNHSDLPVVFVEIQTGDYFGEDDIERYEDDFGRV
jgi:mannose-6-phosphate isomerase-like protein (cupin superfamily)